MVKRRLGIVALATLFNWGCGDKAVTTQPPPPTTPSPTQPISTLTPTQPPPTQPPPTMTPTQAVTQAPTLTPTPPQSLVPVVVSVEKVRDPFGITYFVIHGSHFVGYHLKVTFVRFGIPFELVWTSHSADGTSITASREPRPGSYTPCVQNDYGNGCGNFLVTVP